MFWLIVHYLSFFKMLLLVLTDFNCITWKDLVYNSDTHTDLNYPDIKQTNKQKVRNVCCGIIMKCTELKNSTSYSWPFYFGFNVISKFKFMICLTFHFMSRNLTNWSSIVISVLVIWIYAVLISFHHLCLFLG